MVVIKVVLEGFVITGADVGTGAGVAEGAEVTAGADGNAPSHSMQYSLPGSSFAQSTPGFMV